MQEITLQVSVDETNLILESLGTLPFVKVYGLIAKIQDQAKGQLKEPSPDVDPGSHPTEELPSHA